MWMALYELRAWWYRVDKTPAIFAFAVYYRRRLPTLQGALYFHAAYMRPEWAKEKTLVSRIGRHVFYR